MVEIEESAAFCEITLFQKLFNESFAAIRVLISSVPKYFLSDWEPKTLNGLILSKDNITNPKIV